MATGTRQLRRGHAAEVGILSCPCTSAPQMPQISRRLPYASGILLHLVPAPAQIPMFGPRLLMHAARVGDISHAMLKFKFY